MMIRFRVPIKCNNCGFKSFQYFEWNGQSFIECGYEKCGCVNQSFEIVGQPQQFTNRTDRNVKHLYEDDIVKIKNIVIRTVVNTCYGYMLKNKDNQLSLNDFESEDIKIIGNKYENPELSK